VNEEALAHWRLLRQIIMKKKSTLLGQNRNYPLVKIAQIIGEPGIK
jgi:hypothetical protein